MENEEPRKIQGEKRKKTKSTGNIVIISEEKPIFSHMNMELKQNRANLLEPIAIKPSVPNLLNFSDDDHPNLAITNNALSSNRTSIDHYEEHRSVLTPLSHHDSPNPIPRKSKELDKFTFLDEFNIAIKVKGEMPMPSQYIEDDKREEMHTEQVFCDRCKNPKEDLRNLMICNQCIKPKKYWLLYSICGILFILLIVVIILMVYLYIDAKNTNRDLEIKYDKISIKYNDLFPNFSRFKTWLNGNFRQMKYITTQHYKLKDSDQEWRCRIQELLKAGKSSKYMNLELSEPTRVRYIKIEDPLIKVYPVLNRALKQKYAELWSICTNLYHQILKLKEIISMIQNTKSEMAGRIKVQMAQITNSAKRFNVRTEEYFHDIEFRAIKDNSLKDFLSVTKSNGIYLWGFNTFNTEYIKRQVENTVDLRYRKGAVGLNHVYLSAGCSDNNVKFYNISTTNINLLKTIDHGAYVNSCFVSNYYQAICLDEGGLATTYDLKSLQKVTSYYKKDEKFYSGIETRDKLIIIGGDKGRIFILGNELEYINSYEDTPYTNSIKEVGEVRRGIILTVNGADGCFIYNIRNPYVPIIPTRILDNDPSEQYFAIVSLESGEGDFAIGGKTADKGLIRIYNLFEEDDNYKTKVLHNIEEREGYNCNIITIKEVRTKTILFGGSTFCTKICLWNYAIWPAQPPHCWTENNHAINDFVPIGV